MNIDGILCKYHDNVKMADALKWEKEKGVSISHGLWDCDNDIFFSRNGFSFLISCTNQYSIFFYIYNVRIWVDDVDVLIYKNGWKHNVPIEIKIKLKETIKEIRLINKEYKKLKLTKMYNENKKILKLKKKQRDNKKYNKEQQSLLTKFK